MLESLQSFAGPTHSSGTRNSDQNLRRHPRPVPRPAQTLRLRRISSRGQLPLSRRLRRPRKAANRSDLFIVRLQNQVSRELLLVERKPRVSEDQQVVRILRRVQDEVQREGLQVLLPHLLLSPHRGSRLWQNPLHARRTLSRTRLRGAVESVDQRVCYSRARNAMRLTLVGSRSWDRELGEKRERDFLYLRKDCVGKVLIREWLGLNLLSSPSGLRRISVLWEQTTSYCVQCDQLLWRVWQQWSFDDHRRELDLFFPNTKTSSEIQQNTS